MKIPPLYGNIKKNMRTTDKPRGGCFSNQCPRCTWIKKKKLKEGYRSGYIIIKCGCCNEKIKMYLPSKYEHDEHIELNGVLMDINWFEGLLEFIKKNKKKGEW